MLQNASGKWLVYMAPRYMTSWKRCRSVQDAVEQCECLSPVDGDQLLVGWGDGVRMSAELEPTRVFVDECMKAAGYPEYQRDIILQHVSHTPHFRRRLLNALTQAFDKAEVGTDFIVWYPDEYLFMYDEEANLHAVTRDVWMARFAQKERTYVE